MEFLTGQLASNGVLVVTLHGPGAIQFASKYPMLIKRVGTPSCRKSFTGFGYADYGTKDLTGYGISLGKVSKTTEIVENIPGVRLLSYTERGWGDNHDVIAIQKYGRRKPWP